RVMASAADARTRRSAGNLLGRAGSLHLAASAHLRDSAAPAVPKVAASKPASPAKTEAHGESAGAGTETAARASENHGEASRSPEPRAEARTDSATAATDRTDGARPTPAQPANDATASDTQAPKAGRAAKEPG